MDCGGQAIGRFIDGAARGLGVGQQDRRPRTDMRSPGLIERRGVGPRIGKIAECGVCISPDGDQQGMTVHDARSGASAIMPGRQVDASAL